MNNVKKNNKGFSLVELIVVVLIMAIIAVAMAPQVMKWVDKSRQAKDSSNYDALFSAAQLSTVAVSADKKITISFGSTTTATIETGGTKLDAFKGEMSKNLPGWDTLKVVSTEKTGPFYIYIEGTKVSKGTAPQEVITD